ncbi:radical SAM protein [Actinoplanes sp. CA-054009]
MTTIGSVHSFDVSTGVDGPGTRFVAFLAGCPLRCLYCHSPDTQFRRFGRPTDVGDLLLEIRRYERFLKVARGGVTVSGGEPLQQRDFTRALLRGCKEMGLHTALDTSGFLGDRADGALLDATDLVLLDIKSGLTETYEKVTGTGRLPPTVRFAHRLAELGNRCGCASCWSPASPTSPRTSTRSPGSPPGWPPSSGSRCCRSTASALRNTPRWAGRSRSPALRRPAPAWSTGSAPSSVTTA